jgi:hypothetical protein
MAKDEPDRFTINSRKDVFGKLALIKHQSYAHAHQFKRANRSLRRLDRHKFDG